MSKQKINDNNRQEKLLNKLVNDTCSTLPELERGIHQISLEGLIWNLFKGKYDFSLKDIRYIIIAKQNSEL